MRPTWSRIARAATVASLVSLAGTAAAEEPVATPAAEALPAPEGDLSHLPRTVETPEGEPRGAYPSAPPEGEPRLLSASLSLGPGWLALRDSVGRDGQGATSLAARVSLVVAPEWCLFLGVDRSSTERGDATFAQTAALLGVQRYFLGRLYLGGAAAMAMVKESGVPDGLTDGPGFGFSAMIGVEALRSRHAALTAELSVTLARYAKESWEMGGLRLGVTVF
jgi:hypothetical protein